MKTVLTLTNGWSLTDTGGGCTALYKSNGETFAYITSIGDPSAPDCMEEPCVFSVYCEGQDHSDPLLSAELASVTEAMAAF